MRRVAVLLSFWVCVGLNEQSTYAQFPAVSVLARTAKSTVEPTFTIPVGGGVGVPASTTDSTGGTGAIGLQYDKKDTYFISALFNLGTQQTLSGDQSAFGAALLAPSTQGLGAAFMGSRSFPLLGGLIGFGLQGGLNSTKWQTNTSGSVQSVNGGIGYLSVSGQVGTITLPWKKDDDNNVFKFTVDGGYTMRTLLNDLSQKSTAPFRSNSSVLGVSDTTFNGWQVSLLVNLNDVQPFVRINHFSAPQEIRGFTGTQVTFGITALATLFKSK